MERHGVDLARTTQIGFRRLLALPTDGRRRMRPVICRREKRGETTSFDQEGRGGGAWAPAGGAGSYRVQVQIGAVGRCQTTSGEGGVFIESIRGPPSGGRRLEST